MPVAIILLHEASGSSMRQHLSDHAYMPGRSTNILMMLKAYYAFVQGQYTAESTLTERLESWIVQSPSRASLAPAGLGIVAIVLTVPCSCLIINMTGGTLPSGSIRADHNCGADDYR